MRRYPAIIVALVSVGLLAGCATPFGPKAKYGVTFYAPGAGNFDFGDVGIREGLKRAGYKGQVITVMWTVSFNPAIDQRLGNARLGAVELARKIEQYEDKFPGRPVNVIGLSAGTGVAIWALENLKPGYKVDSVVLLASSLWYRYDARKALAHVKDKIYNYYSPNDPVLAGPMKVFGTIDGVFGQDGAGAVGLHPPGGADRIVNIRWRPEFGRYGYHGGHTDGTSPRFVEKFIAKHLRLEAAGPPGPTGAIYATAPGQAPPAARSN